MAATVINSAGGYQKQKAKTKVSDSTPAQPVDFIPYYARYEPAISMFEGSNPLKEVDPDALRELYAARDTLPNLMFQALSWNDIRSILGEA